VDTDHRVHLFFSHATLDTESDSLGDLSSIRAADMEANNSVVIAGVHGHLNIALSADRSFLSLLIRLLERVGVLGGG